jgi:hypothetical protein
MDKRRIFQIGGIVSGIILVAFGIVVMVLAINGRNTVHDELTAQKITGSEDMTPAAIQKEAQQAGLKDVKLPTCDVAGEPINDGDSARCFAQYMNIHALEATGGKTYAEMPRFATDDGKGTNDAAAASKSPTGAPISNPTREIWVTETALATALNVSYMATQLALFSFVVGIALLLTGVGFLVLSLGGALKGRETSPATRVEPAPST